MIAVECDTDEYLMKMLGFPRIQHCSGKGDVVRLVSKNRIRIGMIDEDPGKSQPSLLADYREVESKESVRLFVHKENPENKLIKISPDLEGWFIRRAKMNSIRLHDYKLTDTQESLHTPHIERRKNFQEFIRRLVEVDEEAGILREWIRSAVNE
jgi:hypothetical protein